MCGRGVTNRVVHEEEGIVRGPFRSGDTVGRGTKGAETGQIAKKKSGSAEKGQKESTKKTQAYSPTDDQVSTEMDSLHDLERQTTET